MVRWYDEWGLTQGVEINTENSGNMHLRKRTIERSNIFGLQLVTGRYQWWLIEYKYLGCMI